MIKILIVEDNEMNRDMLTRRLTKRGYDIVIAVDGAEGIAKANSESPDLILMDMGLPVMDGWAATRHLKQDPVTRRIPVIALTAHAMAGDQQKALAAGCDDYDTKPVDIKRLLPKIEALLLRAVAPPHPSARSADIAAEDLDDFTRPLTADPQPHHGVDPDLAGGQRKASQQLKELEDPGLASTRVDPPAAPVSPTIPPAPGDFSILLVDDNPENRDMLSRRLERQGYQITLAEDGYQALSQMQRASYDLVLLDVMMPGINGFEVLAQLRKTHSPTDLAVVMVTAKGESQDVVQALQLGANDYITKPVDFPVALARIQTQLGLLAAARRNRSGISRQEEGLLKGRYRVERLLASGGFGETYLAADMHRPGHPICVVKQLRPFDDDPVLLEIARRLFNKEAETLERLKHEQIPQLLAYFEEGSEFYLVQEYIKGQVLSDMLAGQPLPEAKVIALLWNLLKVIHYIHQQQVIHRDIKPQNIIRREDTGKLVLIDFGAVKEIPMGLMDNRNQTVSIGSQGFTPLEQLAGRPRFNSDIFALGMVAIQALTGQEPRHLPQDPATGRLLWRNTRIQVRDGLAVILNKMTEQDASQRYQTAIEVAQAIRDLMAT